jgi:hypothetical protein
MAQCGELALEGALDLSKDRHRGSDGDGDYDHHMKTQYYVYAPIKFTIGQATNAQRGNRSIALLFLQPRR